MDDVYSCAAARSLSARSRSKRSARLHIHDESGCHVVLCKQHTSAVLHALVLLLCAQYVLVLCSLEVCALSAKGCLLLLQYLQWNICE